MKKLLIFLLASLGFSCKPCEEKLQSEKQNITTILDNWHKAAAAANYEVYFGAMSEESIFIGTDATENWNKKQFQAFAKPYFDNGICPYNQLIIHFDSDSCKLPCVS